MSSWELAACVSGWNRVHGAEEPVPVMSAEEEAALIQEVSHLLV